MNRSRAARVASTAVAAGSAAGFGAIALSIEDGGASRWLVTLFIVTVCLAVVLVAIAFALRGRWRP